MGRSSQFKQARGPACHDMLPLPGHVGFPFVTMVPPFGFYVNTPRPITSNYDSLLLSDQHAELTRQNLELKADIDRMMGSNAVAQTNSRLQQKRNQRLIPKQEKSNSMADVNAVGRTTSSASTTSCNSETRFAYEADETPKSNASWGRRRVFPGKGKADSDADGMSRSASIATTAGYVTEASYEPDETPASTLSRANRRRVTFADEVDVSPCSCSDRVRKVRFLLPEAKEGELGDAREAKKKEDVEPALRTAVMMCNIPKEYTRANIIELLDEQGFNGLYQLVYVPAKMETGLNYCYTFITFTTEEHALKFQNYFTGFKDWIVPSDKICEVRFNDLLRNTDEHIQRYRNSPMMHESVEDGFKPALFENGQRIPFPAPTKEIRTPRRRKNSACASMPFEQTA